MPRRTKLDVDWLAEHYPRMTDVHQLIDDYERDHGWRPTKHAIYSCANRRGIKRQPVTGRQDRAERTIRWSKEPEMEAWMLEHDHGQRMDALQAEWREHWNFNISRNQVNVFRASHGVTRRHARGGGRKPVPVGTERPSKDGYVVIKFRDDATVPMSKDNWKLKHVWAWEQANGPLPEGYNVYFADGDNRNFDPANLVAVPRRLVGVMNNLRASGVTWHDAQTLEAVVHLAEIRVAQNDLTASAPRVCAICGRTFTNATRRKGAVNATTCPECVEAGLRQNTRRWRKYDHDEIRRLRDGGLTNAEIARHVGCSIATVHDVLYNADTRAARRQERIDRVRRQGMDDALSD